MVRQRLPIPSGIATKTLLANRHACCVCQKPYVQLHHIDENPSNNDPSNLASLCLDHHNLASMQIGLTKKLRPNEILIYKQQWEGRCATDCEALSRDRLRFYCTLYKNPLRIRELFSTLSKTERAYAANIIQKQLDQDSEQIEKDKGFTWQEVPRSNDSTRFSLMSLRKGELWPQWLPRVKGHVEDADYPQMGSQDGLRAFHEFDLYCQLIVRALAITHSCIALEDLVQLKDHEAISSLAGSLVSFRQRAIGKGVKSPRDWKATPLGRVQFRTKNGGSIYRFFMDIKTMYVFSDTAALSLQNSRVCGVGLLADVAKSGSEMHISVKPLIIGLGGLGQSTKEGFWLPA